MSSRSFIVVLLVAAYLLATLLAYTGLREPAGPRVPHSALASETGDEGATETTPPDDESASTFSDWLGQKLASSSQPGEVHLSAANAIADPAAEAKASEKVGPPPGPPVKPPLPAVLDVLAPVEAIPSWLERRWSARTGCEVKVRTYRTPGEAVEILSAVDCPIDLAFLPESVIAELREARRLAPVAPLDVARRAEQQFLGHWFDPNNRYALPLSSGIVGFAVREDDLGAEPRTWREVVALGASVQWPDTEGVRAALARIDPAQASYPPVNTVVQRTPPAALQPQPLAPPPSSSALSSISPASESAPVGIQPSQQTASAGAPPSALADAVASETSGGATPAIAPQPVLPVQVGQLSELRRKFGHQPGWTFVLPREGSVIDLLHVAVPARAPNVEEAMAALVFTLSPMISGSLADHQKRAVAQAAAREFVPESGREDPLIYPPAKILDRCDFLRPDSAAPARAGQLN